MAIDMPDNVTRKAAYMLAAYLRGEIHPRRCPRFATHYLCFNVGYRWRLLCMKPEEAQQPEAWELVTHERYSTLIAKR